jgi:hypothetical protein
MRSQYAKRVDRSQPAIVKTLRTTGSQIIVTNMGDDFPDLLCGTHNYWKLVEVKELDGKFSRGQLMFLSMATGPVDIITGEADGIRSLTTKRRLTLQEQHEMRIWLLRNPNQETIRVQKLLGIIGREIEKPLSAGSTTSTR